MNNINGKESGEDEEVFLDASASPASPELGLRRSARKRKSTCEPVELDENAPPKAAGKRHRPLGNMAGVQHSPANNQQKKQSRQDKRPSAKPTLTVETDPPTTTPTPEQMVLLGGMRAVLKEELSKTEQRLTGRMSAVEEGFDHLQGEFRGLEKRMDAMERKLDRNRTLGGDSIIGTNPREDRYWKARRSLRLWPVEGEGEELRIGLQRFLSKRLRLGEDVISDTGDCSIRKIPPARGKSGIQNEITVEFPTVDLRDVVRGAAYNLAGQTDAGIRLEIPHHLMSNFKALNSASYKLRQKYKECRRNVKFDDDECDLVLDFKISEEAGWKRLKPSQARELLRKGGEAAEEVSVADMNELLEENEEL